MTPAPPFVSVIVAVRNGEETIGDCLSSLLTTDYPEERREIVVVDNGSTDGTARIVKSFPVRYVREEQRGVSHARNRGIAGSRGEIIAFTDADCVVSSRWLGELLRPLTREGAAGAAGEIVSYPPQTPAERYLARRRPYWQEWVARARVPWFLLGNTAFRRHVFSQIGTFNGSAFGIPDIDFSFRCRGAGLRVDYCSEAIVFHRHRRTVRGLFTQQLRGAWGRALVCRRYSTLLSWGWRDELGAWRDLGGGAWRVLRTTPSSLRRDRAARAHLSDAYIDFVRRLAQRIGFVAGTLASTVAPTRFRQAHPPEQA